MNFIVKFVLFFLFANLSKSQDVIRRLTGNADRITELKLLGTDMLLSLSYNYIEVWNLTSGLMVRSQRFLGEGLQTAVALPDNTIAVHTNRGQMFIYNPLSGRIINEFRFPWDQQPNQIEPLNNGLFAAKARIHNEVAIFSIQNPRVVTTLRANSTITSLRRLRNGDLGICLADNSIRIWDINTGLVRQTLTGHRDWVISLDVLSNNNLVSLSYDDTIKIWNPTTGALIQTINLDENKGYQLKVTRNDNLVTFGLDNSIKIWDSSTGRQLITLTESSLRSVYTIETLQNGNLVSASSDQIKIRIWNISRF